MKAASLAAALAALVGAAPPAFAQTYYASPNGSGSACSLAAPCSLAGARARVRLENDAMSADIVVLLRGGEYRLGAPLEFDAGDSGSNGFEVVYRAFPGETPLLTGGQRVGGWILHDAPNSVYRAFVGTQLRTRQLWVDGRRAVRARSVGNPGLVETAVGYSTPDPGLQSWYDPSALEVVGINAWRMFRGGVAAVAGNSVMMRQPFWNNAQFPEAPTMDGPAWIENAYELLDAPGEWYLDRKTGWIYYRPRPGENLATATVVVPALEALLLVGGTLDSPVLNLAFEGLTFAHATWLGPESEPGHCVLQAGFGIAGPYPDLDTAAQFAVKTPGAVRVRASSGVRFERNTFVHLGGSGLDLELGARDARVTGNVFSDISASALQVGSVEAHHPTDPREVPKDNLVSNNVVARAGVEHESSVGIFVGFADHTVIEHNELQELPYSGISAGWGWGNYDPGGRYGYRTATSLRRTEVRNNYVHDVMLKLSDGGAVYTLSDQPESLVEGNHVSNSRNGHCLYHDEGSGFFTSRENVCHAIGGYWLFLWTYSVHDNLIQLNHTDNALLLNNGVRNAVLQNSFVDDGIFGPAAQAIMNASGLEPAYRDIRPPGAGRGDHDGDGRVDLLWRHQASGENYVWRMLGTESASRDRLPDVADLGWQVVGTGDFDGDRWADLLWRHSASGDVVLWSMTRTNLGSQAFVGTVSDTNWKIVGSGDHDGDGRADILWRHQLSGAVYVWLMNGATIASHGLAGVVADTNWSIVGSSDHDGDGRADVLWRHLTSGAVYLWLMNGFGISSQAMVGTLADGQWQVVSTRDFDGNGRADVLWRHATSAAVKLWSMDGASVLSDTAVASAYDTSWQIVASGDFDGDRRADIAWRRTSDGALRVSLMEGAAILADGLVEGSVDPQWVVISPQ